MSSHNTPEIRQFIRENADMFWYIRKDSLEDISHEVLVEFILNYGNEKKVKRLFELLGIERVAEIFYKHINFIPPWGKPRINYFKLVVNFFDLYFKRHVPSQSAH